MRIESGPATDRTRRQLLVLIFVLIGGVWFAYDGWIAWPRANRAEYVDLFDTKPPIDALKIYPAVTEKQTAGLAGAKTLAELEQALGGPPSRATPGEVEWFGVAGRIAVKVQDGRPTAQPEFKSARRTETDLLWQKAIGVGLVVLALGLLAKFMRLRGLRYTLDDAGLSVPGSGAIGWDAMKKLDIDRYVEKGYVDLRYSESGQEKSVRLDSYEIAAFDEIIDELCRRKGFENPLPVEKAG